MPISSTDTYEMLVDRLTAEPGYSLKELVFVNGKPYSGLVSFARYKGCGWVAGRTADIFVNPPIPSSSEVIIIDLGYMRLRKCKLKQEMISEKSEWKWQIWSAIDLPEDA